MLANDFCDEQCLHPKAKFGGGRDPLYFNNFIMQNYKIYVFIHGSFRSALLPSEKYTSLYVRMNPVVLVFPKCCACIFIIEDTTCICMFA